MGSAALLFMVTATTFVGLAALPSVRMTCSSRPRYRRLASRRSVAAGCGTPREAPGLAALSSERVTSDPIEGAAVRVDRGPFVR